MIYSHISDEQPDSTIHKYPYLGHVRIAGKGEIVVLFRAHECGTCVRHYTASRVGEYSSVWHEVNFTPLRGSITITNG